MTLSLLTVHFGCAQITDSFFRLGRAEPAFSSDAPADRNSLEVITYGFASMKRSARTKKDQPFPLDTAQFVSTMFNSFALWLDRPLPSSNLESLTLFDERGCPAPHRKRRYPCTIQSQLLRHVQSSLPQHNQLILIPVLYIDQGSSSIFQPGIGAYTAAYSGWDNHQTWYTLMVHIFDGDELLYYDQYTYYTSEILDEGTPKVHIPQEAMDTLVSKVMANFKVN